MVALYRYKDSVSVIEKYTDRCYVFHSIYREHTQGPRLFPLRLYWKLMIGNEIQNFLLCAIVASRVEVKICVADVD